MQVYSFGVVLWEMITQQSPFAGMAAYQVVEAVVQQGERPPWPEDLSPTFAPLVALAEQCWQTERQLRPAFADLVESLRGLADPQSARASRMSNAQVRYVHALGMGIFTCGLVSIGHVIPDDM